MLPHPVLRFERATILDALDAISVFNVSVLLQVSVPGLIQLVCTSSYQATMKDLEPLYSKYVPTRMEHRVKNAFGLLRGINNYVANGRERSQDQHELQVHQDIRGDWTSWEVSRLVDYAIHNYIEDWAVVVELCSKFGQDPQETEESFRVLIDDIRRSMSSALVLRVCSYRPLRCRPYFASHMPEQTLLETIEEVALSSRTLPVVRDRLVEVVGASVFLLKGAETLGPYKSTWTNLRRRLGLTYPAEGLTITAEDHIISTNSPITQDPFPQSPLNEPSHYDVANTLSITGSGQDTEQATRDREAEHEYEQRLTRSPTVEIDSGSSILSPVDDVRWLFEECETARGNCRILGESLLHATSDSVLKDPLIKEFRENTMTSKEIIDAHIDSASINADHARARRWSNGSSNSATRSAEERLFQALVTTRIEIKYALETYDELAQLAKTSSSVGSRDTPISRQMTGAEVVSRLIAHGCKDLSSSIDLSTFGEYPISNGGFSDVYRGHLLDGTKVALKLLRVSAHSLGQHPKHLKHAARELHTWNKCDHPNVAPLLGLVVFRGRIGMVSPWMNRGSLSYFLAQTPGANRRSLCVQICEGLSYLHQIGIIHGDMKGANVLITDDGTPVLTDFGNAFLKEQTMNFTPTSSSIAMSVRWSAPEIINGSRPTKASDVYALGTTLYEIVSGKLPYQTQSEVAIVFLVTVRKQLPERPECMPIGHHDAEKLWSLFLRCWSEQEARPSAAETAREIKTISLDNLPVAPPRPSTPSCELERRY
ncbi:unnamed protein product [Rhizoctonia solani]|uniref:Uncharacterized protein n=1 Tax=Rhizoctonia solani TaxID=456999 RepID=A0A8H2ZZ14_9AGAM|nr:unnamed protein product [Rhizoctonia solani]